MPTPRQLDQFDVFDRNAEVNNARVARACNEFQEDNPDYYGCPENTRVLLAWLANENVPITRLNLQEAFDQLNALGDVIKARPETIIHELKDQDKQGDRGITKMGSMDTVRLRYKIGSDAERNLAGQQPHRANELLLNDSLRVATEILAAEALSEPGKPITKELKQAYQASLSQERGVRNAAGLPKRTAEARAVVALNNPDMNKNSAEFSRLVAETLSQ